MSHTHAHARFERGRGSRARRTDSRTIETGPMSHPPRTTRRYDQRCPPTTHPHRTHPPPTRHVRLSVRPSVRLSKKGQCVHVDYTLIEVLYTHGCLGRIDLTDRNRYAAMTVLASTRTYLTVYTPVPFHDATTVKLHTFIRSYVHTRSYVPSSVC